MKKEEKIIVDGKISEVLPNTMFHVEIEGGHKVLAYLSGKMRLNFIKIVPGDKVKLEMTPYDISRGRIISREK
jgi:translation initiation factor IF-1